MIRHQIACFLWPWNRLPLLLAIVAPPLAYAQEPAWWAQRSVFSTNATGNRLAAFDYAVVNQGQLKNIVAAAIAEMNAGLPGGAGPALNALLATWSAPDSMGTRQDFAAANIGQVKVLAALVYDRLIAAGFAQAYPWAGSSSTAADYSLANIGQVKALFSIDLAADSDLDGLPDWWEILHFGNLVQSSTADPDSDGFTNRQELYHATNPLNSDTNGDGISDSVSVANGLSPTTNDTDGDGVINAAEIAAGTNPLVADSDGDGVNDGQDVFPLDPDRSMPSGGSTGDTTPPLITLLEPVGAVPVP
jgi:hypothetical protein